MVEYNYFNRFASECDKIQNRNYFPCKGKVLFRGKSVIRLFWEIERENSNWLHVVNTLFFRYEKSISTFIMLVHDYSGNWGY